MKQSMQQLMKQYEKNGKVYYGAWSRVEATKRGWEVQ